MARKPRTQPAAAETDTPATEAEAPVLEAAAEEESPSAPLIELFNSHGAHLAEVRRTDGDALQVKCHAPHSVERFVAAARAHPHVHDVQVLAAHIELHVAAGALAADAED